MSFSICYITHATKADAKSMADQLIAEKLIACANLFPITSSYLWKGNVENDNEWVSLVKTTNVKWEELEARVLELHPYEVPCVIRMEVTSNEAYEKWIFESVGQANT